MPHYFIKREPIPDLTDPIECQDTWLDGCYRIATWRVSCGLDAWFFCDEHEGPPCGGVFFGQFVITPQTTREELLDVVSCGAHRIHSVSGHDVHELWCCACGEWVGDIRDPEIKHVSVPLAAECHTETRLDTTEVPCAACEQSLADTPSITIPEP